MQYNTIPTVKVCGRCKISQPLSNFHNNISKPDGKANSCKPCNRLSMKPKTKEQSCIDVKNYAKRHPERVKASWKKYYEKNKELLYEKRKDYEKRPESIKKIKERYEKYKPIARARAKVKRMNMSPHQKVCKKMRDRFNKVIIKMKSGTKHCSWRDLVGCNITYLKEYIENQFTEGMNWGNHGNGDDKWNIDHIIPLCKFNLFDIDEQKKAFHYTNIRPLWFKENMRRERQRYKLQ